MKPSLVGIGTWVPKQIRLNDAWPQAFVDRTQQAFDRTFNDIRLAEDPIAAWLYDQPQLPQLTASKDAAEFQAPAAKPTETTVEKPVLPAPEPEPQPATASAPDQSITPTPAVPSLTLPSAYPSTQYPPFPESLALPTTNVWPSAVAETPSPTFAPPQPPR